MLEKYKHFYLRKIPGNSRGNLEKKTNFREFSGIPEKEFEMALFLACLKIYLFLAFRVVLVTSVSGSFLSCA